MNSKQNFLPQFFLALITLLTVLFNPAAAQQDMAAAAGSSKTDRIKTNLNTTDLSAVFEKNLPRIMQEAGVPGLAIAVIRDGKTYWKHPFGVTNAETKAPVTDETVFEAASLSKPVFAYAVLKLVEAGKLDLDTPLTKYLPAPYIENDERLNLITARLILTHTSGLPNIRRGGQPLTINFTPGERFSYSGEGFLYLQKAVERITDKPLEQIMKELVFEPLGMKDSSYLWQDRYAATHSYLHDADGNLSGRREFRTNPLSFASLHCTAGDYAVFVNAVLNKKGLKKTTFDEMLRPQVKVDAAETDASKIVSWGLGWGLENTTLGKAIWHWGDNGDTKAFVVAYPEQKSGLIMFANSANGLSVIQDIIAESGFDSRPAIDWRKFQAYNSPERILLKDISQRGRTAVEDYAGQRKSNKQALTEERVHWVGYQLLNRQKFTDAIEVFKLNVEDYPASANAYDDLGEAYMKAGEKELAAANYKKSLELNPKNTNAVEMLKKLAKPEVKIDQAILASYTGKYETPFGVLTVTQEKDKLYGQLARRPREILEPESETNFIATNWGPLLVFVRDKDAKVYQMIIRGGTVEMTVKKIE